MPSSSPDLTAKLHAHGINNRYLGYIRSCLKSTPLHSHTRTLNTEVLPLSAVTLAKFTHDTQMKQIASLALLTFYTDPGTNVQQLLLVTMVSRVAKTLLRSSMRSIVGETGQALFEAALVSYAHSTS